jgi:glutathione S-transferase
MKLYGAIASPYVTRVVMFARLKGVEIERDDPPGGPRSDDYRSINPIGKIPSLVVDGVTIPESETICEYIEDSYPEPSGLPEDALGRATSRTISRIVDLYLAPNVSTLVRQVDPATRDQAVVDDAIAAIKKALGYLEHFMGPGPFAAGDKPTLGDCAAAPYMMLTKMLVFANFDGIEDPTEGDGRLAVWWNAIQSDKVCADTVEEYRVAFEGFVKWLMQKAKAG